MKFEYGDFYKFVASLGIGLIGLSILAPWLFLREPFDLLLTQSDLTSLTPLAQSIIAQRQALVQNLINAIPWFSLITFPLGFIVLGAGGFMWFNRSQRITDELNKRQLSPLTSAEVKEQKTEEAKAELLEDTENISDLVRSTLGAEEKLVVALRRCFGETHEVLANRRLGSVIFDVVLLARSNAHKDYIVEIKTVRRGFKYGWVRDNIIKMVYANLLYQKDMNRESVPILFIVGSEKVLSAVDMQDYAGRIHQEVTSLNSKATIAFAYEDRLDSLTCEHLREMFKVYGS
jgi:hypothetical protein